MQRHTKWIRGYSNQNSEQCHEAARAQQAVRFVRSRPRFRKTEFSVTLLSSTELWWRCLTAATGMRARVCDDYARARASAQLERRLNDGTHVLERASKRVINRLQIPRSSTCTKNTSDKCLRTPNRTRKKGWHSPCQGREGERRTQCRRRSKREWKHHQFARGEALPTVA
jgi:hypothetical protein